jgi:hypothetical protein
MKKIIACFMLLMGLANAGGALAIANPTWISDSAIDSPKNRPLATGDTHTARIKDPFIWYCDMYEC